MLSTIAFSYIAMCAVDNSWRKELAARREIGRGFSQNTTYCLAQSYLRQPKVVLRFNGPYRARTTDGYGYQGKGNSPSEALLQANALCVIDQCEKFSKGVARSKDPAIIESVNNALRNLGYSEEKIAALNANIDKPVYTNCQAENLAAYFDVIQIYDTCTIQPYEFWREEATNEVRFAQPTNSSHCPYGGVGPDCSTGNRD